MDRFVCHFYLYFIQYCTTGGASSSVSDQVTLQDLDYMLHKLPNEGADNSDL
jgi:hypothetical protein